MKTRDMIRENHIPCPVIPEQTFLSFPFSSRGLGFSESVGFPLLPFRDRYFVVYPPLTRMVCPVIHQPSETRQRTMGTMSSISVRPVLLRDDRAAAVL